MKFNKLNVVIITCWILLVIALILKLFGLNWFEPVVNSKNFLDICDFIENNLILKYIITCLIALILNSLSVLAILGQRFYTKIQAIVFIPFIIIMSIISWYSSVVGTILGVILYLLPIIWLKKKWYRAIIGIGLIYGFQLISILAKNVGSYSLTYSLREEKYFIGLILQIDSIIMTILYYLYASSKFRRKEEKE